MKGLDFVSDGDEGFVTDERYVRLYTRDTPDWLLLPWEARAVYALLSRKLDRAGILEIGTNDPAKAVAVVVGLPLDVVRVGLAALLDAGFLELRQGQLLDPVFIEAQEAKASDAARAREYRFKRRRERTVTQRDAPEQGSEPPCESDPGAPSGNAEADPESVTQSEPPVTPRDGPDTPRSPTVTLSRTVPSLPSRPEESTSSNGSGSDGAEQLGLPGASPADAGTSGSKGTKGNGGKKRARDPAKDPDVIRVFAFWQKDTGHEKAKLDAKRAKRIRARLDDGFTPDELEAAIRNRRNDAWLMGEDPKSTRSYDELDTLLRDVPQVERLRDLTHRKTNGRAGPKQPNSGWKPVVEYGT